MIRDGTTGDWIGSFVGHKGAVWSCQLDPTGNLAATASGDFSVRVWDAITGKVLWIFPHQHIVKTCAFSSDSHLLATGGHEGLVRVYDLRRLVNPEEYNTNDNKAQEQQKQQLPSWSLSARHIMNAKSNNNNNSAVVISKVAWWTKLKLIAACADGTLRFWDLSIEDQDKLQEPVHILNVDAEIRDMEIRTLTNSGRDVLTVAAGTTVSFFDLQDLRLMHSHPMPIHFRDEGGASLHPHGNKFVAGGSDLWVRVFCMETGQELECHKGHHGPIRCVRYSPDGTTYATGSEDGTIRLWKTDVVEDNE
jgi:serine-threonine kinase receptor-associated protein